MLNPRNENIGYWSIATLSGFFLTVALFLSLNNLKLARIVDPDPVMVVDLTHWREPIRERIRKPRAVKPKPKPAPKPIVKPKPKPTPKPKPLPKPKLNPEIIKPKPELTQAKPAPQPVLSEDDKVTTAAPSTPAPATEPAYPEQTLPTATPIFKLTSIPRFAHRPETIYPPAMREQGKQAVVKLKVLVDKKGLPRKITVVESAGPDFDQAAIETIRASTFIPGKMNGKAVAVILHIPIKFELK